MTDDQTEGLRNSGNTRNRWDEGSMALVPAYLTRNTPMGLFLLPPASQNQPESTSPLNHPLVTTASNSVSSLTLSPTSQDHVHDQPQAQVPQPSQPSWSQRIRIFRPSPRYPTNATPKTIAQPIGPQNLQDFFHPRNCINLDPHLMPTPMPLPAPVFHNTNLLNTARTNGTWVELPSEFYAYNNRFPFARTEPRLRVTFNNQFPIPLPGHLTHTQFYNRNPFSGYPSAYPFYYPRNNDFFSLFHGNQNRPQQNTATNSRLGYNNNQNVFNVTTNISSVQAQEFREINLHKKQRSSHSPVVITLESSDSSKDEEEPDISSLKVGHKKISTNKAPETSDVEIDVVTIDDDDEMENEVLIDPDIENDNVNGNVVVEEVLEAIDMENIIIESCSANSSDGRRTETISKQVDMDLNAISNEKDGGEIISNEKTTVKPYQVRTKKLGRDTAVTAPSASAMSARASTSKPGKKKRQNCKSTKVTIKMIQHDEGEMVATTKRHPMITRKASEAQNQLKRERSGHVENTSFKIVWPLKNKAIRK